MTYDQQLTLAQQLERAAEILRSDAPEAMKIDTLTRIGGICTYAGGKWGEKIVDKMVDSLG